VVHDYPAAAPYESGQFYKRELPYLIDMIGRVHHSLQAIVIDGYVWLGPDRPGLGAHLFDAINGRAPVVGVAKTAFVGAPAIPVLRGESLTPLFVSTQGLDPAEAAVSIAGMHGRFRIPTLLKRVDSLSRS
jgi:deoxyribonuclease V